MAVTIAVPTEVRRGGKRVRDEVRRLQEAYPTLDGETVAEVYHSEDGNARAARDILAMLVLTQTADRAEHHRSGADHVLDPADVAELVNAFPAVDAGLVEALLSEAAGDVEEATRSLVVLAADAREHAARVEVDVEAAVNEVLARFPHLDAAAAAVLLEDEGYKVDAVLALLAEFTPDGEDCGGGEDGEDRDEQDAIGGRPDTCMALAEHFPSVDAAVVAMVLDECDGDAEVAAEQLSMLSPQRAPELEPHKAQQREMDLAVLGSEFPEADLNAVAAALDGADGRVATARHALADASSSVVAMSSSGWGRKAASASIGLVVAGLDTEFAAGSLTSPVAKLAAAESDFDMFSAMFPDVDDEALAVVWEDAGGALGDALDLALDLIHGTDHSSQGGGEAEEVVLDDGLVAKLCATFEDVEPSTVVAVLESAGGDVEAATSSLAAMVAEDLASSSSAGAGAGTGAGDAEFPALGGRQTALSTRGTWARHTRGAVGPRIKYVGPRASSSGSGLTKVSMAVRMRRARLHDELQYTEVPAAVIDETFDSLEFDVDATVETLARVYPGVHAMVAKRRAKAEAKRRAEAAAAAAAEAAALAARPRPVLLVRPVAAEPYRRSQFAHLNAAAPARSAGETDAMCREANALARQRNAAFAAAAQAFRSGNKSLASRLASQGRALDVEMREVNAQRVSSILGAQDAFSATGHSLDLHGLFEKEAINVLARYLLQHRRSCNEPNCGVRVITGVGNHSKTKAKIRPAVVRYFRDNRISFREEAPGVYRAKVRGRRRR
ncbi:uncharacterized protein AMSG_05200 [Thecamonas trahens ATCC 50062]|uniref:Smr domain-containing protein n=1 Tax=Thecamonas trahens ATCC 50062 TaxID=461836 RepID=A0A0L0DD10_THETB|nr:hypothetical protein AMSG_05200 [Thecamonas trahens ATCC 50062]KNC49213.1 hypothetical protein AMSG_05200 [Thecamonas trahens ATCC 50062]|eukprot:XP_013757934.1 hypothetical protein AMSG_05200 [Thecamonas trahens ATCC 50062]